MSQTSSNPDDLAGSLNGSHPLDVTWDGPVSREAVPGESAPPEAQLPEVESAEADAAETTPAWVVTSAPATRTQRAETSLLGRIVPPVLGGLAAIPIAIAILWYGFGRDLGNAGPTVARYIPAIVPRHLRGNSFRDDGTFGGGDGRSLRDSNRADRLDWSSPSVASGPTSQLPSLKSSSSSDSDSEAFPHPTERSEQTAAPETSLSDAPPASEAFSDATPLSDEPRGLNREVTDPSSLTPESLREIIAKCEAWQLELKENWPNADNEQRQAMAREFYSSCLRVAEGVVSQKSVSLQAWKRELDTWSRAFLAEPAYPRLLTLCLEGKIEGIPPHQSGGAVVLVDSISVPENTEGEWKLPTHLTVNDDKVMVVVPEEVHRRFLAQTSDETRPVLFIGVWRKMGTETPWIETVYASW
ncbi:hypothetical protein VN12_23815 [Pirellula sp. SH-Sr6A]|uniref:hypothetical protein n=1 Tax=Pirellula sp. SH-Sr6A TaxID=1632865 RepID=UPI00078D5F9C|nr:hypothetical protein [Pirellula sp. SH-Sr6A]AMV35174.1 hypothetical protein VN12_23815 [Pirellula sp. SH-Sr6A]